MCEHQGTGLHFTGSRAAASRSWPRGAPRRLRPRTPPTPHGHTAPANTCTAQKPRRPQCTAPPKAALRPGPARAGPWVAAAAWVRWPRDRPGSGVLRIEAHPSAERTPLPGGPSLPPAALAGTWVCPRIGAAALSKGPKQSRHEQQPQHARHRARARHAWLTGKVRPGTPRSSAGFPP